MAEQKTFKIKRVQIGVNVLIQVAVAFAILVMVNYLAFNHYKRWDFSRNQQFRLASQTKGVIKTLNEEARIIVFFAADTQLSGGEIYRDLANLIKEFKYSARDKMSVEYVDPIRDFARAREIAAKYNIGAGAENVVIVEYQGRSKVINARDMAQYDMSPMQYGEAPRLQAFTGEEALASALLEVTERKQKEVHFLLGQGEPDIADAPSLSTLKAYLERQNLKVSTLNLTNVEKVPDEARVIILVGPKYDLSERELDMVRKFWIGRGRLFVMLDPTAYTPSLANMLVELGVKPMDNRIMKTSALTEGLAIAVMEPAAEFLPGNPITKKLAGVTTRIPGPTQSLDLLQRAVQAQNIKLQPLIRAAEGFWGESEHTGEALYFDPKKDQAPPLTIAASIEQGALDDQRVQVDSSRAIIVGNNSLVSSEVLTTANLDFILGGINWLLDRDRLIGVAPKAKELFSLDIPEKTVNDIARFCMFIVPFAVLFLGLIVWWVRRR